MNAKITGRRQNPALAREELALEVEAKGATPSRKELRKKIAALTGSDEGLVVVGRMGQGFGSSTVKVRARLYKTKEAMESTELGYVVNRNLGIKKAKGKASGEEAGKAEPVEGEEKQGAA